MTRNLPAIAGMCLVSFLACPLVAADGKAPAGLPEKIGVNRGVCVVLEDKDCQRALDLARAGELTIYVQLSKPEDVQSARRAADAAGLLGRRIFVGEGSTARIHLADNVADAVIAPADSPAGGAEALRVLRPGGKAIVGAAETVKPWPDGVDEWSHNYHSPDNNPFSRDKLARAPYMTQFISEPRYGPAPQSAVASGGRIFMAFGHIAWHQREEPAMNTLFAMNGFNGTLLWKMPLKPGIMVDRSTMVATPTTLYLGDNASCKGIDAATGGIRDEIVAPADLTDGPHWKWMAMEGGVLYALVGKEEPLDADAKWRSTNHGWPWGGISKGYNAPDYAWGFAGTLLAIDPATKKVLWHRREPLGIDSRSTCMRAGRITLGRFGHYLTCLDARTGKEVWRRTAEKDPDLFKAIGPYRPGQGYIEGWKTTVYLKCTEQALYFVGPQVEWVTAISADEGKLLWTYPKKDLHVVIRDDALYTISAEGRPGDSKKLDPLTGKELASYDVFRRACTRTTATVDGILFRAPGGSVRLDLATGKTQWISPMRPSCHVGVVIAAGHLYWLPWTCDCNLQMYGVICLGPAGTSTIDQKPADADRLEPTPGAGVVAKLDESPADWPTYRSDNTRSARTQAAVPDKVKLLWQFVPKAPCEATAPVAAGGLVFVAGSDGVVRAFDAASGQTKWTAYTGGASLYPPTIAAGRALVGSGDGWVYAFEAATGKRLWRFRAAPAERRISIYGSLMSTWPAVCGAAVEGGVAYVAAGINNFDGTHVFALDAATGKIKWHNGDSGRLDEFSRRGASAQGDMLLHGGRLYLAGGCAVSPAMFDLATGRCLNDPLTAGGGGVSRSPRGRELVLADGKVQAVGQPLYSNPANPVFDNAARWPDPVVAARNASVGLSQVKTAQGQQWVLSGRSAQDQSKLWDQALPGEPARWGLAVDRSGGIIVSLRDGRVLYYGADKPN